MCSYIRVADKTLPAIAYFNEMHKAAFEDERVDFVQADLTREAHIERAYNPEKGPYDYVFNMAGETKSGLSDAIYASKCRDLSVKCATMAQTLDLKRYIEVSTAFVYKGEKKNPATEVSDLQPWTRQARYKLEAEEEIRKLANIKLVIVRPAIVYGPADFSGLMPRIVCAASYVKLEEKMKLLWKEDMRVNTVHVHDVCRAMWHLTEAGTDGAIYNLADKNDTNQCKINLILQEIFGIETGFHGKLLSGLARVRLPEVVNDANDKHMRPWSELCMEHGVTNTPLTPYIDKELLQHTPLHIDGSAIERETGFEYTHPNVETDEIRDIVQQMIDQKIFPPILC
ncbi:unnamed protein product [Albugo candida]|nr:unnamed protein product [Albugo candida]|eukprot:CCI43803.1 unnamed protein product [Albugo candida]